jgi:hypothetical protein
LLAVFLEGSFSLFKQRSWIVLTLTFSSPGTLSLSFLAVAVGVVFRMFSMALRSAAFTWMASQILASSPAQGHQDSSWQRQKFASDLPQTPLRHDQLLPYALQGDIGLPKFNCHSLISQRKVGIRAARHGETELWKCDMVRFLK